jgi:hypothetical protein
VPAADDGSKKKKKKQDAAASPSAPAEGAALEQPIASVGDKELAAKGKPIRKVLYTEHPEVAAMSTQQVQQLREERQMTVEGCDIKPLVSFQQVGEQRWLEAAAAAAAPAAAAAAAPSAPGAAFVLQPSSCRCWAALP